ncbi:helix-turn-helix domain-containing protein [Nocardioides marmoraquaticus]
MPPPVAAPEPAPYGRLPVGSGRQVWTRRPADEAERKALASPLRLRLLRAALHEPRTNAELAELLDLNPASCLHHVRTLVDTGFLVEQEVRRGRRGARERPYLASGKSFYVDTGADPSADVWEGQDLLLATFLQDVAGLDPHVLDTARLGFRLSAADREVVQDRLHALLQEVAAMPTDPDGESWSLFLALHPDRGS